MKLCNGEKGALDLRGIPSKKWNISQSLFQRFIKNGFPSID
jgi:hypothetical protein